MQGSNYIKSVASAVFAPVVKSLFRAFPEIATGLTMTLGLRFRWDTNGMGAYNNKIYYAADNIFVRKITEAPITFNTKKTGAGNKFQQFYSKTISNEKRYFIKTQSFTEVENHPLNVLFDTPNSYQSGIEMMEDFWHNYGFGDGFLFFQSLDSTLTRNNKPMKVHSLNRSRVRIVPSSGQFDRIAGYEFYAWDGSIIEIPKENILHLKQWNPSLMDLKGLGVDVVAAMDVALNNNNSMAQGAIFVNGGRGTLFSSKATVSQTGKVVPHMTKEQMDKVADTVQKDMAGVANNGKMKFTNGEVQPTPYGDTMADMELVKAEEANWKNIFAIRGIPWSLAPITTAATDNNVAAGYKALVTNLIISEIRKFDQKLNQTIKKWWPEVIAITDLTEYTELAPNLETMQKVYGTPVLSEDEKRAIFGYDEMPNGLGKNYLVPSNLMKYEDVIEGALDAPNPIDINEEDAAL